MKAEDFGIDTDTGAHDPGLTWAEAGMLEVLGAHVGAPRKIPAAALAIRFYENFFRCRFTYSEIQDSINQWKRTVRYMVNHLIIDHDQAILSKAGVDGGYWIAESKEEVDEFYGTFRKRAMTGLTKAARGKKAVMASIVKQLAFEFDDLKGAERPALMKPYDYESAPLAVMTAFLDKMTREPEKFETELRILRDKFGKVLMPKEDFGRIQALSRQLTEVLARVA